MTLSLFPRFLAVACLLTTPAVFSQEQIAPAPPAPAASNPKNVTTPEVFDALAFDITRRGTPLDLSGCRQTFFDGFDTLSVSAPGGPDARWFGPVHGGFGKAKFLPPGPDGPFSVDNGNLIITARKDERGWWTSGIIESADRDGKRGFSQQYGYFEMRAEFPAGEGSWPAFWLKAAAERGDRTLSRPEIDIVEWYGGDARGHHACVHLWPASRQAPDYPLTKKVGDSNYFDFRELAPPVLTPAPGSRHGLLTGFHTYGCEVTPDWVIFYFDRKELSRFPTIPEYRTPLFMLVNLAIFQKKGVDVKDLEGPRRMAVDYVGVWQREYK